MTEETAIQAVQELTACGLADTRSKYPLNEVNSERLFAGDIRANSLGEEVESNLPSTLPP